MSQLRPLIEVEGIWKRRLARAEDALRKAQKHELDSRAALDQAQIALNQYIERLPGLIEQLYSDCIGHMVTRQFVQDKAFDEGRLRARVAELRAEVTDAEKALAAAIEAVRAAQLALNKERVKLEAMQGLIKDERSKLAVEAERSVAKIIDDLSGSKYTRRRRQSP